MSQTRNTLPLQNQDASGGHVRLYFVSCLPRRDTSLERGDGSSARGMTSYESPVPTLYS